MADKRQRREPRITAGGLHRVRFVEKGGEAGGLAVTNISASGIGLVFEPRRSPLKLGASLSGSICLDNAEYPVKLRVVHVTRLVAGCLVEPPSAELKMAVEAYFAAELEAQKLCEVNPMILKREPDGNPRLFRSGDTCELFLVVEDGGRLVRYQMSFLGNYIEGAAGARARFGFVYGDADKKAVSHPASSLVQLIDHTPGDVANLGARFVTCVPGLTDSHRETILASLRQD